MYTILVCGGRDQDPHWVCSTMKYMARTTGLWPSFLHGPVRIVSGGAKGADQGARLFFEEYKDWEYGLEYKEYPAEWDKHGKRAGPIRNQLMLDKEDVSYVLAFPGGVGTTDMVVKAARARVNTRFIEHG